MLPEVDLQPDPADHPPALHLFPGEREPQYAEQEEREDRSFLPPTAPGEEEPVVRVQEEPQWEISHHDVDEANEAGC